MNQRRPSITLPLWASTLLLVLLAPAVARADERCAVRLVPRSPEDSTRWTAAVDAVANTVHTLPASRCDCASIEVVPASIGTSVLFEARDGRRAERRIVGPSELRAVVDALLIGVPAPERPETDRSILPSAPEEGSPPSPKAPADPPTTVERTRTTQFRVSAGGGAKLAWPNQVAAAVLQVSGTASVGSWELGVLGRWEPAHALLDQSTPRGYDLDSMGGGILVGHRHDVGRFVVFFGSTAAVYAVEEEIRDPALPTTTHGGTAISDSFAEPRLGAYLGCSLPRMWMIRLRTQLTAEGALAHHTAADDRLPTLPRWSLGLGLGAETDLLP